MMEPWFALGSPWWALVALLALVVGGHKEILSRLRLKFPTPDTGSRWMKRWIMLKHPLSAEKRAAAEFDFGVAVAKSEEDKHDLGR